MKILLDECVPVQIRNALPEHEIHSATDLQWRGLDNGELLRIAEQQEFQVIVVADKNMLAQNSQCGGIRHVNPACDHYFRGFDVEVQAGSGFLRHSTGNEYGRHVCFIGALVGTEADIAINAIDGAFRVHNHLRGRLLHCVAERQHQLGHRGFDLQLVNVFVCQEPFPVVVPLELP
jgi:hypothetical protein